MTAVPQARRPASQVCLQLQFFYLQRPETCVLHGCPRSHGEGGGGRGVTKMIGVEALGQRRVPIFCPSCCVSGDTTAAPVFLSITLMHSFPLLCWIFGLTKAFSSSGNSNSQTLGSPRLQGLTPPPGAAWGGFPAPGHLARASTCVSLRGYFAGWGFQGSSRDQGKTEPRQPEHGNGQGPTYIQGQEMWVQVLTSG